MPAIARGCCARRGTGPRWPAERRRQAAGDRAPGFEVVRACAAERIRTGVGAVPEPRAGAARGACRGGYVSRAGRAGRGARRQRRDPEARGAVSHLRLPTEVVAARSASPAERRRRRAGGRAGGGAAGRAARAGRRSTRQRRSGGPGRGCDANPPARQPAQVRPARHRGRPARRGRAGARARGRAGRGRGALPDGPGARRSRRRLSSAWRSGASWSRRSNAECARGGPDNVRSVFANMSVDMPRLFAAGQRAALLPELSRSLVQEPPAQAARDRSRADGGDRARARPGRRALRADRHLRARARRDGGARGSTTSSPTPRARGRSCARAPTPPSRAASASARPRALRIWRLLYRRTPA